MSKKSSVSKGAKARVMRAVSHKNGGRVPKGSYAGRIQRVVDQSSEKTDKS